MLILYIGAWTSLNHIQFTYVEYKMQSLSVFPLIGLFIIYSEAQLYVDQSWEDFKVTSFIRASVISIKNTCFQAKFNKTYIGHHDIRRKTAWEENIQRIIKHNEEAALGYHSYTINQNHLSDLVNIHSLFFFFRRNDSSSKLFCSLHKHIFSPWLN